MLNNIMDKLYKYISKNWFIVTVFGKLSSVWFSLILTFFGDTLFLVVAGSRNLTWFGWVCTTIVVLISLCIAIVEKYHEVHDDVEEALNIASAERDLSNVLVNSLDLVCRTKMDNQLKHIRKIHEGEATPDHVYTQPCEQLKDIADQVAETISFLTSEKSNRHDKEDFQISLLYNFPQINPDHWEIAQSYTGLSLSAEELLAPGSTLNFLLTEEKRKSVVFFNSKQRAFEADKYVKCSSDEYTSDNKLKGSIACILWKYSYLDDVYIKAVLTIATKKKSIVSEDKLQEQLKKNESFEKALSDACEKIIDNINHNLLEHFRYRYGIELCNYYIQYLYDKCTQKED